MIEKLTRALAAAVVLSATAQYVRILALALRGH